MLFFCSCASPLADGIVTVFITVFYFSVAVRYINYQYKLYTVLPALREEHPVEDGESRISSHVLDVKLNRLLKKEQPFLVPGVVIADIAVKLNVSPRILSYYINQMYGLNFNTWINRLRIEHARMLIERYPSMNFVEISEQSGFSDKTKFSRVFKETTGLLYKEYRKRFHQP